MANYLVFCPDFVSAFSELFSSIGGIRFSHTRVPAAVWPRRRVSAVVIPVYEVRGHHHTLLMPARYRLESMTGCQWTRGGVAMAGGGGCSVTRSCPSRAFCSEEAPVRV